MKKIFIAFVMFVTTVGNTFAYQVLSTKEIGKDDARNQNVIVKCTTDTGKMSEEVCSVLVTYIICNVLLDVICDS